MEICEYGCGKEAYFYFKSVDRWCCNKYSSRCPDIRKRKSEKLKGKLCTVETRNNMSKARRGKTHTIETRKKMSKSMRGKTHTIETRKKMSKAHKGKIISAKTKKKMSESTKGTLHTNETKKKISEALKGKSHTIESRKNMSEGQKGKTFSVETRKKMSEAHKGKIPSVETRKKMSKARDGKILSVETRKKISEALRINIEKINKKYPIFSKIEEMRYNPNKLKEIQVHCKNHNCENSKEKGGWFTPTKDQLFSRIYALEKSTGNDGCYIYCCQECKDTCVLFRLRNDPYSKKDTNLPYTDSEYNTWRAEVDKRADGDLCEVCGEEIATDAHHIRPVKLEPFFALDPDFGIMMCEKCHYEKGHTTGTECSTGNLAKKQCQQEGK